jgi:hypothetical protein
MYNLFSTVIYVVREESSFRMVNPSLLQDTEVQASGSAGRSL